MKVSATSLLVFFISAALALGSGIGFFTHIRPFGENALTLMAAAYGVLFLGLIFKGRN